MSNPSDIGRTFQNARRVFGVLLVVAVLLYGISGVYVVEPEQRGVVSQFGRVIDDKVQPGMHYHLPWPIESVVLLPTTEIRSLSVPFRELGRGEIESGSLLTGDENLVQATLQVQYVIRHPQDYLFSSDNPEHILQRVLQWNAIHLFADSRIDDVLTTGRQRLQRRIKQAVQKRVDELTLGISLTSVQLQSVEPPAANGVAIAFNSVADALEEKQKKVNEASGERNRRLPKARAEARSLLLDSEAHASEVVQRSQGDSERFLSVWNEYRHSRTITGHRLYLNAIDNILPRVRKLIINPSAETEKSPETRLAKPSRDTDIQLSEIVIEPSYKRQ